MMGKCPMGAHEQAHGITTEHLVTVSITHIARGMHDLYPVR